MSLIQEALKRQEEEQKAASNTKTTISEAISDDVKLTLKSEEPISHPDIIAVSTPGDSPILDPVSNDNDGLDDFILPDGFSMDNFSDVTQEEPPLIIKDDVVETPSLLAKKEELAFNGDTGSNRAPLTPPSDGLGSLKLQNKEVVKKLYEDPTEQKPVKKSKKKKKVVAKASEATGTVVHPALNKEDSDAEQVEKKSITKVLLAVILFIILILVGIYYGLTLISSSIDMTFITKYIPGKESYSDNSTKISDDDLNKGTINASKVVENPKSTAGKAIQKAETAAQKLQQAQTLEGTVTETLTEGVAKTVANTETVNTTAVPSKPVNASDNKSADKSLAEKYQNSRMTERIKAKLEAKRLEEKRLSKLEQKTETVDTNVDWPSAALSGTIGLSKNGAAIFDKSNIVNVGETYKGMKLVDVTKDKKSGVILEYKGQTRFLATGQSL